MPAEQQLTQSERILALFDDDVSVRRRDIIRRATETILERLAEACIDSDAIDDMDAFENWLYGRPDELGVYEDVKDDIEVYITSALDLALRRFANYPSVQSISAEHR